MTPAVSRERRASVGISCQTSKICSGLSTTNLLLEHFFDLSDFLLNFAGVFFDVAFGL
jgi:hypothetical protein